MSSSYRIALFDAACHNRKTFDCGVESLNTWFREHAQTAAHRNTAKTWVLIDSAENVCGYYSLAAHKISRDVLPSKLARGGPQEIPAVLLAKLAVDKTLQSSGLGRLLLTDALKRIVLVAVSVGTKYVVVDATNERTAAWYESMGFTRRTGQLTLVQSVRKVAAAFTAAME